MLLGPRRYNFNHDSAFVHVTGIDVTEMGAIKQIAMLCVQDPAMLAIQALLWASLPDGTPEGPTFRFSLIMSAMNVALGMYTLRRQAGDLPGIGWAKPVCTS